VWCQKSVVRWYQMTTCPGPPQTHCRLIAYRPQHMRPTKHVGVPH